VSINGPSKTIAEVENSYKVKLSRVVTEARRKQPVRLIVAVDDEIILDEATSKDEYIFTRNFSDGYHKMIARIVPDPSQDYFLSNNVFYKTTHVIQNRNSFS